MNVFYTDHFVLPLPEGHRFPMAKYSMLRQRVARSGARVRLRVPHAARDDELERVHTPEYVRRVQAGELSRKEIRDLGFPWSPELVERSRRSCGATIEACRAAIEEGIAVSLAGGTHHAFRDRGEGFCVFNDSAVAACAMQDEGRAKRVAIVDCDVHQGNGTAHIFWGDSSVFTFSIHSAGNYPFAKEKGDLDIDLPDGTTDEVYLEELERGLAYTLDVSSPEVVIYLAGADPFAGDRLGRLSLSKAGLGDRDDLVLDRCRRSGVPVAIVMAGGYGRRVTDTVDIHHETVCRALRRFQGEKIPGGPTLSSPERG